MLVDGENCGTVGKFGSAAYYDVKCSKSLWGSQVLVYLTTTGTVTQLIVCEIEVYEGLCVRLYVGNFLVAANKYLYIF